MFISFSRVNIQDFSKCCLLQDCCMGERVNTSPLPLLSNTENTPCFQQDMNEYATISRLKVYHQEYQSKTVIFFMLIKTSIIYINLDKTWNIEHNYNKKNQKIEIHHLRLSSTAINSFLYREFDAVDGKVYLARRKNLLGEPQTSPVTSRDEPDKLSPFSSTNPIILFALQ